MTVDPLLQFPTAPTFPGKLCALVVESDPANRHRLLEWLEQHEIDAQGCDGRDSAMQIFHAQNLILANVGTDAAAISEFVQWARGKAGSCQPYVVGLGDFQSPAGEWHGFNEFLPRSIDENRLEISLSAAMRWAEWTSALHGGMDRGKSSSSSMTSADDVSATICSDEPTQAGPTEDEQQANSLAALCSETEGPTQQSIADSIEFWKLPESPLAELEAERDVELATKATPLDRFLQTPLTKAVFASGLPIFVVRLDGCILAADRQCLDLGVGRELKPGESFWWEINADVSAAAELREEFLAAVADGLAKDGTWRPLRAAIKHPNSVQRMIWTLTPVCETSQTPDYLLVTGKNAPRPPIAKKQGTEPIPPPQKLEENPSAPPPHENAHLFQAIAEKAPFGILILKPNAEVDYANPQHAALLSGSVIDAGGVDAWLQKHSAAEPEGKPRLLEKWWDQIWRKRYPVVLTMRTDSGILKEVEFRPAALPENRLLIAMFDVTDSRREEESMRASEARYRAIFNQSAVGMVLVNATGNITDANSAFERMTGCSRLDIRRHGLEKFFAPADSERIHQAAKEAASSAEPVVLCTDLISRQAPPHPVTLQISVVRNNSGTPVFTAYHLHWITDSVELSPFETPPPMNSADQTQIDTLLGTLADITLTIDESGTVFRAIHGPSFGGYPLQGLHLEGQSWQASLPFLTGKLPFNDLLTQMQKSPDSAASASFNFRKENGRPCYAEAKLRRIAAGGEQPECLLLFLRDVTATVERFAPVGAESLAPQVHGTFGFSAIKMLRQAAIVTSEKGRITECNPSAERLFGYSREELIGAGLYRLFLPDRPKEFAARISEHLNKHRCWIGKSTYFRKDQSRGRLSIEMVPYEENGTRGFLTLMRDISTEESPTPESPSVGTSVDASGDPPAPGGHSPTISLHRARNDFQLLSSLLNMQSGAADPSADVREALRESRDRLGVLALVYRLISEKNGLVSFKRLAEELCRSIIVSENRSTAQISVAVDETSPEITQRLATTLGLILSELVSDVVSRSFPVGTSGRIHVGLEIGSEDGILILEDNGSLQSEDTRVWHRKSISGQVLSALVEQLRGTISYTNSMENQVRVRFKPML